MIKHKKRILICSIVAALVLSLIYLVFFSGFKMYISYVECSQYDDFDSVVDDFERIVELAKKHGNGSYIIISKLSKRENDSYKDIKLSKEDNECLKRIQKYCHENAGNKHWLDSMRVTDRYIQFEYEDFIDCGIVYTTDINSHWGFFSDYGYTKLTKNWYAYYR